MVYSVHSPKPYSGTYGPTQKPGLIHRCSGFAPEKNFRNTSSSTQPNTDPRKNRYAKRRNKLMLMTPF